MRQGEQGWLLAGTRGNHEFSKVFYLSQPADTEPRYILRDGVAKLGGIELLHLAVDAAGAWLQWTEGLKSHIPTSYFQLTWAP